MKNIVKIWKELGWLYLDKTITIDDAANIICDQINGKKLHTDIRAFLGLLYVLATAISNIKEHLQVEDVRVVFEILKNNYVENLNRLNNIINENIPILIKKKGLFVAEVEALVEQFCSFVQNMDKLYRNSNELTETEKELVGELLSSIPDTLKKKEKLMPNNVKQAYEKLYNIRNCHTKLLNVLLSYKELRSTEIYKRIKSSLETLLVNVERAMNRFLPTRFEIFAQPMSSRDSVIITSTRCLMHLLLSQLRIVDALADEPVNTRLKVARGVFYESISMLPKSLRYLIAYQILMSYKRVYGGFLDVLGRANKLLLDWREEVKKYLDSLDSSDVILLARIFGIEESEPTKAKEMLIEKITKYSTLDNLKDSLLRYIAGSRSLDSKRVFKKIEDILRKAYLGEELGKLDSERVGRLVLMLVGIVDMTYITRLSGLSRIILPKELVHRVLRSILRSTIATPRMNRGSFELTLLFNYAASREGTEFLLASFLAVFIDAYVYYKQVYEGTDLSIVGAIDKLLNNPNEIDVYLAKFMAKIKEGRNIGARFIYSVYELISQKELMGTISSDDLYSILNTMKTLARMGEEIRKGINLEQNIGNVNDLLREASVMLIVEGVSLCNLTEESRIFMYLMESTDIPNYSIQAVSKYGRI